MSLWLSPVTPAIFCEHLRYIQRVNNPRDELPSNTGKKGPLTVISGTFLYGPLLQNSGSSI